MGHSRNVVQQAQKPKLGRKALVKRNIILAMSTSLLFVSGAASGAPEGFFIGAGAGQSTMKAKSDNNVGPKIDLDENDTSYKGFAGYNFTNWLGVEGGYVELGSQDQSESVLVAPTGFPDEVKVEVSANGWQGFAVLYLPLGHFDLFAKVGGIASNIDTETKLHFPGPVPPAGTQHDKNSEGNGMWAYGAGAAYNFGHWSIRAEYEAYDVDKLDDLYNVTGSLVYTFFREKETPAPVMASTPAPAPKPAVAAAPAKCPDADHDGVCDADDACPNTPPGTRVGPAGCDCDYVLRTHFAFNSADLTAEDKTQLDQLATRLLDPRLHFVTGEVDGYTDSTGDAQYNLKLSKRRADAVADYLKSKGVKTGDRYMTQGFGEERPIADNSTEEGRAQNRRVSIHRTDCPAAP
jgi:outer membrane protein OmpA-like peptidoglycan-associated protein